MGVPSVIIQQGSTILEGRLSCTTRPNKHAEQRIPNKPRNNKSPHNILHEAPFTTPNTQPPHQQSFPGRPYLSQTVHEVVLDVATERVVPVTSQAELGPLSGPGEVGLQGGGARVLDGHEVRVVGPHVLVEELEARVVLESLVFAENRQTLRAGSQDGQTAPAVTVYCLRIDHFQSVITLRGCFLIPACVLLTLAPLGGGGKGPPLWFFANSS